MSTTARYLMQAVIAGVVAAVLLVSMRGLSAQAQWGGEATPEPAATAASEPPAAAEPEPATPPQAGPSSSSGSTGSSEMCTLITRAEAQAALGIDVTTVGDAGQCTYVAGDLSGRSVSVAMSPVPPSEDGVVTMAMTKLAEAMHGEVRHVDVGEEASVVLADVIAQVGVRLGDDQMLIVVLTAPQGSRDEQATTLTELARVAVSRL